MTRWPPLGGGGRVAWKPEGSFREFRAIGGSTCRAARRRCRQRPPDIRPDGTPLIAAAKGFRRNCRAENDGKQQRPESALAETSFPALAPRATRTPSARGPRRTPPNGSNAGLRVSPPGSNRVTCGGGNLNPFRRLWH